MRCFQNILVRKFLFSSFCPTKVRFLSANCSWVCPILSRQMSPIQLWKNAVFNFSSTKIPFINFVSNAKKRNFSNKSQSEFSQNRFWLLHLQIPKKIVFVSYEKMILIQICISSPIWLPFRPSLLENSNFVARGNFFSPVRFFISLHITDRACGCGEFPATPPKPVLKFM